MSPARHGAFGSGEFARAWPVIVAAAAGVGLGITGLPIYTTGQFVLPLQNQACEVPRDE